MELTAIGLGIIVFGAAFGIGKIGQSAIESMSRQPEISGKIQTAMIVAAALIEGIALFGIVVAWLA
ncbi:MAG: synthase, subunit c [Anaerophaga sp.]|nr:synthase, subunit c [Anaerophaga sp.]MDK2842257.1 F-type H+-transporting ATPase subunit c [Anaerophaga sp.]MDN5291410.1 F-type H+-transporting ATPase subunit c [Anaerophaga sp.]